MRKKLCFIIVLTPFILFAKGYQGEYIIEGIMHNKNDKTPLSNQEFIINGKTIRTNEEGKYSLQIKWSIPCRSISNHFKGTNPYFVTFQHHEMDKKVKNKWRNYGLKHRCTNEIHNYYKDLYW